MSEHLNEDPWTDEVCLDWVDQEIARTGNDVIQGESMPPAVRAFVKRLVREQHFDPETDDRTTSWAKANLIANTGIIDVDLGSTNR